MAEIAETARVYPCPLPDCPWEAVSEPPGPAEEPGALAEVFGWGVMSAVARNERFRRLESKLTDHLLTHTLTEFAIALANANKRIAELEGREAADDRT